jgi:YVTN family beta-propeller protein
MTKSLQWLFVIGLPSLVLLGVFIHARSSDSSNSAASPNATLTAADEQVVVDHAKTAVPDVALGKFIQEGISVEFSMARLGASEGPSKEFFEGDDVRFRFRITDSLGAPLTSVYPAAWLVTRPAGSVTTPQMAVKRAESMINASIFSPAELDLNVYYVLTLNSDATITVVDPLFGYGGTKLLALIPLKSPGADWALSHDETTVYVSLPESHEVAIIDTATWEVRKYVPGGLIPERIALQPDGHYLWVGGGGYGERVADSGVTVLNTDTLEVVARIRTGLGRHDIAFSDDSRFAFVTNSRQDTVSIIDVRTLKKRGDVPTGKTPVSIDYSATAQVAYVSHVGDGSIAAVSAEEPRIVARLQAEKGLGQIKFAPNGRHGFVVNTELGTVHILDAATNRIVQTVDVEDGPDQLAFSDELAYVRHRGSPNVLMIPLGATGVEGSPVPVVDFPAGQNPAGQMSRPCLATSMIQAPGASAMLVANPLDQAVYFYKEGMAAPMGTFSNYRREPLAVMVVDRSLRERTVAGCYETVVKLREPNSYDVVFFLDAPRIMHCFPIEVEPDPEMVKQRNDGKVDIKHIVDAANLSVGESTRIRFKLTDRNGGTAKLGLDDVMIQTFLVPDWHDRLPAQEIEPGVYAIDFTPPRPGVYYISAASASIGVTHDNPELLIMRAVDRQAAVKSSDGMKSSEGTVLSDRAESSDG